MKFTSAVIAASLLLGVVASPSQTGPKGRPTWPRKAGVYLANSSETIPAFPSSLRGYRSEPGMDFWGKPFTTRGTIRVFQDKGWQSIWQFPSTMNGCSAGVFMLRWRSGDAGIPVQSSTGTSPDAPGDAKTGSFGYMTGSNCEEPLFKFTDHLDRAKYPEVVRGQRVSYLVDVHYELKFWQAAP
jgi:hypothetical protein